MAKAQIDRKDRRAAKRTAIAGATLTAAALTAGITPPAAPVPTRNLDVLLAAAAPPQPAFGIGPLGGLLTPLLNATKMNPLDLAGLVSYQFSGGAPTTRSIYNLFNELPYGGAQGNTCKDATQTGCRTAFVFSTGLGSLGTTDAIHALVDSAMDHTRPGFDPLKVTTGTGLTQTSTFYINNMLRPDGGMSSRFPELTKLFGIDPAMPPIGFAGPNKDGSSVFNFVADITWPYNNFADFPITANPFSLINSAFAVIPSKQLIDQLMTPGDAQAKLTAVLGDAAGTIVNGVDQRVSLPSAVQCKTSCTGYASPGIQLLIFNNIPAPAQTPGSLVGQYIMTTATNPALPITYPTYILSALVNPLLKAVKSPYLLGTPMADILTPPMKILVNIGYDDVITPDKLNTVDPNSQSDPKLTYAQENYTAYSRTFVQPTPDKPTPFAWFNNPAMTADQTTAAYGDAFKAFTGAVQEQAKKPLFGVLVPNPDNPPAAATSAAASAAPAAAAAESAPAKADTGPAIAAALADDTEPAAPVTRPRAPRVAAATGDSAGSGDSGQSAGHAHRGAH